MWQSSRQQIRLQAGEFADGCGQVSYDWSRGFGEYNPQTAKNYILLHSPQESEVKNRQRPQRGR